MGVLTPTSSLAKSIIIAAAFLGSAPAAAGLSEAELVYHDKIFSYAMDMTAAGQGYGWASHNGKGTITAGATFVSKSRYHCREFTEAYEVQGANGLSRGVACKRIGQEGWCRLKPGDAMTCAMENRGYAIGVPFLPSVSSSGKSGADGGGSGANVDMNTDFNANVSGSDMRPPPPGNEPSGKDVAYEVTDTFGKAGASGTGIGLGWWRALFR